MTPTEILFPGVLMIVFVTAWFVFGVLDSTRDEARARRAQAQRVPVRASSTARR